MKKILLMTAIAVFAFTNVNAQSADGSININENSVYEKVNEDNDGSNDSYTRGFEQGDIYLSGSLGFWSTKTGDVKDSQFSIMPAAGFLVSPNISVGLTGAYMSFKGEVGDVDTVDETLFNIGAYGAYHFNAKNRFSPYMGVGFGFNSINYNLEEDDFKATGFTAGVFTGADYWFSDCFAIFTQLGVLSYSSIKPDYDGAESTNDFGLDLNMKDVALGAKVRF